MNHPDRMARLLFGSTRREVLGLLLGRPGERFYFREVLRASGGGSGAVQRELKNLVGAGLVVREKRGNQVYFSANREAPIFPELQSIFTKTAGAVEVLRTTLRPLIAEGRIQVALVYGSVAAGKQTAESDIDLLVVGEAGLSDVVPAVRVAEARLGREINPTVYPAREFRSKLRHGAAFLKRVLNGPKLFVTGDEHDLGQLAGESLDSRP